jgi:formylglycine-generating enzyme required for sulfatase activity
MFRYFYICLILVTGFILTETTVNAQEFPIAVGSDTTFSGGAVYGGLNGLVAVQGDASSQYNINAQLIGAGGVLIGSRFSLGAVGMMPGAIPVFDGTNYFLVWREFNGNLKGQFINTSGSLVGTSVTIGTNVSIQRPGSYGVVFGDTAFMVVFTKTDDFLYGQRVSRSGNLIGGQIQISTNLAREVSLAYDGTNYLATWVKIIPDTDKDIYGQFVSKAGSLVGSNFLIDGGPNYSDNPTSLAFDGTRYLLAFHEQPTTGGNWFLLGRFISTSGAIEETITIHDTSNAPFFPSVAFDNKNYLITWTQRSNASLMGRFYNTSGVPIDSSFVIFGALGNKTPLGGVGFGGGLYLAIATRIDANFSNGDVYGRFISPLAEVDSLMVPVVGGTFQMGSTTGESNEQPAHTVMVSSFDMDITEVTFEKWTLVRDWGLTHGYTDLPVGGNGYNNPGTTNHPVTEVNWYDAVKWCNARSEMDSLTPVYYTDSTQVVVYKTDGNIFLVNGAVKRTANGYRLPTEAEWEFAAMGGTQTHGYTYSGSNVADSVAWTASNSASATHPVANLKPNELGLYDMSGNVIEWCWDRWGYYTSASQTDPQGPTEGPQRDLRGGHWGMYSTDATVKYRSYGVTAQRIGNIGFRCVQSQQSGTEVEVWNGLPQSFGMEQNYPNPFNPTTTINYRLPIQAHVTLKVFDVLGREVATLVNQIQEPGYKSVSFNANNLASGIYYYRLQAGTNIETKKLLLIR